MTNIVDKTPAFDLNNLKPKSDVIEVTLLHPSTLEPLPTGQGDYMKVEVFASHSKEYKSVMHEQTNKRIQKAQKNKKAVFTSEELEGSVLEILSKVTKSWNIVLDGDVPKLTTNSAMEVYQNYPWIKEQVEEAINDNTSFLKV